MRLFTSLFLTLFLCASAQSALITGFLDTGSGVIATGGWEDNFSISWEIEEVSPNLWQYTYCVEGDKDLSHLIIEVTEDCEIPIYSQQDFEGPKLWTTNHPGNPGLPEDLFGVKFDGGSCFTFFTNRNPVLGDFYAKSGTGTIAFNDTNSYILRPNGDFTLPEPGSLALLGLGAGIVFLRRHRLS